MPLHRTMTWRVKHSQGVDNPRDRFPILRLSCNNAASNPQVRATPDVRHLLCQRPTTADTPAHGHVSQTGHTQPWAPSALQVAHCSARQLLGTDEASSLSRLGNSSCHSLQRFVCCEFIQLLLEISEVHSPCFHCLEHSVTSATARLR